MSNSFFTIPNLCVSGTPEKSYEPSPSSFRLQDEDVAKLHKVVIPPPGFAPIDHYPDQNSASEKSCALNETLPIQNQIVPHFAGTYKPFSRMLYPRPSAYRYIRYRHFTDRRRKIFQKSAYILASIRAEYLKELGAVEYVKGICVILRQYEPANSSRETCAIIGLSKHWVRQLSYRFSNLYHILRSLSALNNIPGIQDLSPYKLNVLKNLMKYINDLDDNELILFNIEPKGQTSRSQHYYPTANLCLPGGGMEAEDEFDWKKTAFREFEEETGFKLNEANVQMIDQQKWNGLDRESMYIVLKISQLHVFPTNESSN
jgi:hypothetical protein